MARLLVVEDEPAIRIAVTDALAFAGYVVEAVEEGESALRRGLEADLDAIVLDIMLPRLDGFEVCRRLREAGVRTPILMLTARGAEADRVEGLSLGADDYLPKPFSVRELLARVAALLRRASWAREVKRLVLRTGAVEIDGEKLEIRPRPASGDGPADAAGAGPTTPAPGGPVAGPAAGAAAAALTPREAAILRFLALARGRVVTRRELLHEIWGWPAGTAAETRTVENTVSTLRRKIQERGGDAQAIVTVRGEGFKLGPDVAVELEAGA